MADLLARAACGTAAVDLSLPESIQAGETIHATVELFGGALAESVNTLAVGFTVDPKPRRPGGGFDVTIPIASDITVHAAEHRVLDVPIAVPSELPSSIGATRSTVGLVAEPSQPTSNRQSAAEPAVEMDAPLATDGGVAEFEWAEPAETGDIQPVTVHPDQQLGQVLDTVAALGFFLVSALPLPPAEGMGAAKESQGLPRQEFRFRPRWGPYEGAGDLYLYPEPAGEELQVGVGIHQTDAPDSTGPSPPAVQETLTVRNTDREAVRADLEAMLERLVDPETR